MRVTGEHAFTSPRSAVWAALQDPQMLANALPGVKRLEVTAPDEYAITISVGVGSVKGTYDGVFALTDKVEGESCSVRATASGGPGSVDATARMTMRDADGSGAQLTYEADANVTGPLAGGGPRRMASAARRTTGEFLSALDRLIAAPPAAAPAAAPAQAAAGAEEAAGAPAAAPAPGAVFTPAAAPAGAGRAEGVDPVVVAVSVLSGFLLAVIGILLGRRTARR